MVRSFGPSAGIQRPLASNRAIRGSDGHLSRLVAAWSELSVTLRADIVAMIEASRTASGRAGRWGGDGRELSSSLASPDIRS